MRLASCLADLALAFVLLNTAAIVAFCLFCSRQETSVGSLTQAQIAMDDLIFQTPVESNVEAAEEPSKPNLKPSNRPERLGFAFFGLVLFMIVYFARPEDWIPGLGAIPLAKIAGIIILSALVFSVGNIRWHMPREVFFSFC